MRKLIGLILATLGSLVLLSCSASTSLKSTWRDPSVQGPLGFQKVLALMVTKDGATRRTVEDDLVRRISARTQAVAGYTLLMESDLTDKDHAKQILQNAGVDGAVVLRVKGVDKQVTYVPGTYPPPYYNFYGYYDYAWPAVYDPGYMQTDTVVNIETLVYSLKDEKLVWTGVTETFNPSSIQDLLDGIAKTVAAEMTKQGLIQ